MYDMVAGSWCTGRETSKVLKSFLGQIKKRVPSYSKNPFSNERSRPGGINVREPPARSCRLEASGR